MFRMTMVMSATTVRRRIYSSLYLLSSFIHSHIFHHHICILIFFINIFSSSYMQIDDDGIWLNHTKANLSPRPGRSFLGGRLIIRVGPRGDIPLKPRGDISHSKLEAISHSKETFMKATMIWGVGVLKKLKVKIATSNNQK